jgi:hypothetical protein
MTCNFVKWVFVNLLRRFLLLAQKKETKKKGASPRILDGLNGPFPSFPKVGRGIFSFVGNTVKYLFPVLFNPFEILKSYILKITLTVGQDATGFRPQLLGLVLYNGVM